jgi:hypothetical protein
MNQLITFLLCLSLVTMPVTALRADTVVVVGQPPAAGGGGGITLIADVGAGSPDSGDVTTGGINTTGADFLVAVVSNFGGTAAVSDSKGNTWTALTESADAVKCRIFYTVPSSVGASHTFTVSGATYPAICVAAFSGVHATPADQQNGATDTGVTSLQPGSVTPSEDAELVVTGLATRDPVSMESINDSYVLETSKPNNQDGVHMGAYLAYRVQTTAAATNPAWSWTTSRDASARIATFKAQ